MTLVKVKKLFRRCLLVALTVMATGCASVQQMPSTPTAVGGNSVVTSEQNAAQKQDPIEDLINSLGSRDVSPAPVSEKPGNDELVSHIASKWNVSTAFARDVVRLADEFADRDFPKRNDILAIIAVESGFNRTAHHRGSFGLMQIQVKSHRDKLKGKNVYNPRTNIQVGVDVLKEYYILLGRSIRASILAFNAGIGNYQKGRYNSEYYRKYRLELAKFP